MKVKTISLMMLLVLLLAGCNLDQPATVDVTDSGDQTRQVLYNGDQMDYAHLSAVSPGTNDLSVHASETYKYRDYESFARLIEWNADTDYTWEMSSNLNNIIDLSNIKTIYKSNIIT
jgi:hypothetical protein